MIKKITSTLTIIFLFTQPVLAGGVSNIEENGKSASGKTMYKITCSNGKSWRIYRANGEWYDAGIAGAQGGQSRDLNEQADFLCR